MRCFSLLLGALLSTRALGKSFATKRSLPALLPRQSAIANISFTSTAVTVASTGTVSVSGSISACAISPSFPPDSYYTITEGPTTTSAAAPVSTMSCTMQESDPDSGIDSPYCICDGSKTLPLRTLAGTTAVYTASCDYTTVPASATISPTVAHEPPVTNIALCQVCTLISDTGDTPPTCSAIPGCIPQKAIASVTAGSSPVHVGTLTGTALYTSVSSALVKLCPDPTEATAATQCTGEVSIRDISYVEDESISTDGSLVVSIDGSSYNTSSLKTALIDSIALAVNSSAVNGNCYTKKYTVEEARKRSDTGGSWSNWASSKFGFLTTSTLEERDLAYSDGFSALEERDRPYPVEESIGYCNTIQFAAANYYNQYWRLAPKPGPSDYIYTNFAFHVGPGGSFACDFLQDLTDALAIVAPEFAVEDVELGEAIDAICCESLECSG